MLLSREYRDVYICSIISLFKWNSAVAAEKSQLSSGKKGATYKKCIIIVINK